jgi:probable rRNA maturation factor
MMSLTVHLDFAYPAWKRAFPRLRRGMERAAGLAFAMAKKPPAFARRNFEIAIVLTDDRRIRTLNHDFRGMNKPTNVLSFPQLEMSARLEPVFARHPEHKPIPLGDVVLAWQTVKRECREQSKPLENHALHLVVHGTLHLLGYDHIKTGDAKTMEKLECDILRGMGYPDPYHAQS